MMRKLVRLIGLATTVLACSSPSLDDTTFACTTDADCLGGKVCVKMNGALGCILPDTSPLRIGMSAPFQGPSQDLGIEMRRGIQAAFTRINRSGGVFGRALELESLNDNYDPDTAYANVRQLLDVQQDVADKKVVGVLRHKMLRSMDSECRINRVA